MSQSVIMQMLRPFLAVMWILPMQCNDLNLDVPCWQCPHEDISCVSWWLPFHPSAVYYNVLRCLHLTLAYTHSLPCTALHHGFPARPLSAVIPSEAALCLLSNPPDLSWPPSNFSCPRSCRHWAILPELTTVYTTIQRALYIGQILISKATFMALLNIWPQGS